MTTSDGALRGGQLLNIYGGAVVDNLPCGVLVVGRDGRIVQANAAYRARFGVRQQDLLGRPALEAAPRGWSRAALRRLLADAGAHGEASGEFTSDRHPAEASQCTARRLDGGGRSGDILICLAEPASRSAEALRAAELSHRIKNSLQILSSSVAIESRRPAREEGYAALQARIMAIAALYDVMARAGVEDPVSLDIFFEKIAEGLRASLLGGRPEIAISVDVEPVAIAADRAEALGLILNELATNAVKHAFPQRCGRIVLGVRREADEVVVWVADDGVGCHAPAGGQGSGFVAAFARQLGAQCSTHTGPSGSRFEFRMPSAECRSSRFQGAAPAKRQLSAWRSARRSA